MKGATNMSRLATLAAVALVALGAVSAAAAGQNSATTTLSTPSPASGTTIYATFTVFGATPVVPYEYALENVCTMKTGNFRLGQHDDIVYWDSVNGNPTVTMPIYLESVPSGATCRVSLTHNNTAVKGSTVQYTVG
jgi:hypothetical protein